MIDKIYEQIESRSASPRQSCSYRLFGSPCCRNCFWDIEDVVQSSEIEGLNR
jgi:hypothetical protein